MKFDKTKYNMYINLPTMFRITCKNSFHSDRSFHTHGYNKYGIVHSIPQGVAGQYFCKIMYCKRNVYCRRPGPCHLLN